MSLESDIQLAEQAKGVLDNEAFQMAFETLNTELTTAWLSSPVKDADGREKLFLMVRLLSKVKTNLESMVTSGKMAEIERRTLTQRAKDSLAAWTDGN